MSGTDHTGDRPVLEAGSSVGLQTTPRPQRRLSLENRFDGFNCVHSDSKNHPSPKRAPLGSER